MSTKKTVLVVLSVIMISVLLVSCAKPEAPIAAETEAPQATDAPAVVEPAQTEAPKPRAVLIANRPTGDKGSIDNQVLGLQRCESELGYEIKVLESTSPDRFEEDIRAMAKEGYNLIITAFPPVTEANKNVARDFPDIKFAGIYEFGNLEDPLPNLWDTEYQSQELTYVLGAMAGKLSTTKKLGYISGQETASSNSGINGWMQGVAATCPECTAEFAYVGDYTDLAKAKEIAKAMISRGVDIFQTAAGQASQGVVEAADEAGILVVGDNSDFFEVSNKAYVSWMFTDFGANVFMACKESLSGEFQGGQHTFMNMANGGAAFMWDKIDRFIEANPDKADLVNGAVSFAHEIEKQIVDGTITVEFNTNTPTNLEPTE